MKTKKIILIAVVVVVVVGAGIWLFAGSPAKHKVTYATATVSKGDISNSVTATGLPSSNVLYYELSDNAWCCVRPSGTEPKIKFYVGVKGDTLDGADQMLEELKAEVLKHFE